MRLAWTLIRIVLVLASLGTLFLTPVFVSSPAGTTIDPVGAIVDGVALIVLVAAGWSLWRDRARLV